MRHSLRNAVLGALPRSVRMWTIVGGVAVSMIGTSSAFAGRMPQEDLRYQLLCLHGRLIAQAMESPEIAEARAACGRAYANLYQIRENILAELRKNEDYTNLRLALWHQQQQLSGMHLEVPVKVRAILASASDAMSIRGQITQMEIAALEADETFLAARDELNTLIAAQQRTIAEAVERVRTDPQLQGLSQQLQSMRRTYKRADGPHRSIAGMP